MELKTFLLDGLKGYDELEKRRDPTLLAFNYLYDHFDDVCEDCPIKGSCDSRTNCPAMLAMIDGVNGRIQDEKGLRPWVGVELDGTLAEFIEVTPNYELEIGDPIEPVVELVKSMLKEDLDVRIFSHRVATSNPKRMIAQKTIRKWTKKHLGKALESTAEKDILCVTIFSATIRQLVPKMGIVLDNLFAEQTKDLNALRLQLLNPEGPIQ